MRNILTLVILFYLFDISAQTSTLTEYKLSSPSSGQLSISAVFNGDTPGNVFFSNATINVFIPTGYSIMSVSNGLYMANIIPAAALDGACGTGVSYDLLNLTIDAEQNLGSVTSNIPEALTTITFDGTDALPALGLQFPTIVPLQICMVDNFGFNNTGSVRIGLNTLGYSNVNITPNQLFLPIILKSFDVAKLNDRSSKLNWTTSSEINSNYFGVERSKDGNNWETIGKVAAAGNSSSDLAYEFIDDNLPLVRTKEQVFYYRLRMTDLDAQYKYSDVRGVNFGKSYNGFVSIYPNPTAQNINVDLSGMDLDGGTIDLSVYSMSGQMMIKKNIIGNGIELIDVTQLPASTYNVVVKQGDKLYQQKIIKID